MFCRALLHTGAVQRPSASRRRIFGMIPYNLRYVPPYALLKKWTARFGIPGTDRLTMPYDDVLDVLKGLLLAVPVDEEWYPAEYPAIREYLVRSPTETPASHFRKHGYFEGRKPFAPTWRDLTEPVSFRQLRTRLQIIPTRGRLRVDIAHDDFLGILKSVLIAVPVDQPWYCATYPDVAKAIEDGTFPLAADHYAQLGYFEGRFPFDIIVDEEWYVTRYDHVRTGLERGVAADARDHFMKVGYNEGCRPTPP
jgi:hypothetical protein